MTIENNKTLGLVGAVLMLTGIIGTVISVFTVGSETVSNLALAGINGIIGFLAFIGFILFLVSMYGFSRDYGEPRIFNYIIYGFIGVIVTAVAILIVWGVFTLLNVLNVAGWTPSTNIESILAPYVSPLIPMISIVGLIWIYFTYKSYNLLADKSETSLFRRAAKIFVLGAFINLVVAMVFAVFVYNGSISFAFMQLASVPGGLVQYGAWVFVAKGFYAIKPLPIQTVMPQSFPSGTPTHFCTNCGAPIQTDYAFCMRCGKKLQ